MKATGFIMPFVLFVSVTWFTDFDQAMQQAKEKDRLILLNFSGSDWCAPCIKMKKEIFNTQEFQDFADDNLILLKADFPRLKKNQLEAKQKEHNEKLAERFNPKGKFPLTLLIDANGNVVHEWDGYSGTSVEVLISEIKKETYDR